MKMTVNNAGNINPLIPQQVNEIQAGKQGQAKAQANKTADYAADRVEISRQAKSLGKALTALNQMSDVRIESVEKAIQERVIEGNRVPAFQLSAKFLLED